MDKDSISNRDMLNKADRGIQIASIIVFTCTGIIFAVTALCLFGIVRADPLLFEDNALAFRLGALMFSAGILLMRSRSRISAIGMLVFFICMCLASVASYDNFLGGFGPVFLFLTVVMAYGVFATFQYQKLKGPVEPRRIRGAYQSHEAPDTAQHEQHSSRQPTFAGQQPPKAARQPTYAGPTYAGPTYAGQQIPKAEQYAPSGYRQPAAAPQQQSYYTQKKDVYMPSLILGIIAIATFWFIGFTSILLGAIGLALTRGRKEAYRTMPGFILSLVGLALGVVMFVYIGFFM